MPKETFFNLPDEKRESIEATAVSEFAAHGYDNASINRIVANAKIAKGSFYQYFAGKKDLYKHLMMRIAEKKIDYLSPILQNLGDHDFFTLLQELYRSGLDFARQNPKAALIGNQIFKYRDHPIHQEIFKESQDAGKTFYEQLIRLAISRCEIRPYIDISLVIHILNTLNVAIFEYYFETVKVTTSTLRRSDCQSDLH